MLKFVQEIPQCTGATNIYMTITREVLCIFLDIWYLKEVKVVLSEKILHLVEAFHCEERYAARYIDI